MPVVASLANASAGGFGFAKPKGFPYLWVVGAQSAEGNYYFLTSSSTTGANGTWTARTSSFGTTDMKSIASNGKDLYVAVGSSGKLATSPDGITWTQQTSSFGTTVINYVAYGSDGYWVAVGNAGKLATSTDGITWTQRTSGTTAAINTVTYGASLWAYGATSGVLRTATDPTGTWTSRTSTISGSVTYVYYWPDKSIWCAGRDNTASSALASSTNGTTWTARASEFDNPNIGVVSNSTDMVIGFWDVLGGKYKVQSTEDGTSWSQTVGGAGGSTGNLYAFGSDDLDTLAMNIDGDFYTSTNASTWTNRGAMSAVISGETATPFIGPMICHSSGLPSIRQ